jgi:hypothetical protein
MRGDDNLQEEIFNDISLEKRVPADKLSFELLFVFVNQFIATHKAKCERQAEYSLCFHASLKPSGKDSSS